MEALAQKLDGEVLKLTHQEFPEKVSRNTWMIFFGTKWCKFCQRLMPKWSRLELRCKENIDPKLNFNVAKVDCTEDEDFCEHYGVDGYPTILLFSNGKVMEEYHNEQSIGSLVEYALSMSKKYRSEENEEL